MRKQQGRVWETSMCFSLTALGWRLDRNPNKTGSLQWSEEDKFGLLFSFPLFDASLTKKHLKCRNPSRLRLFDNGFMSIWRLHKGNVFCFQEGNPVLGSKFGSGVCTCCQAGLQTHKCVELVNISAAQTEGYPSSTKRHILSLFLCLVCLHTVAAGCSPVCSVKPQPSSIILPTL